MVNKMDIRIQSRTQSVKAIFFDIDGTLLSNRTHQVPQSTIKALETAHANGIMLFVATGRHKQQVAGIGLDGVAFTGYITLNGQYCYDRAGNVIHKKTIDPAGVRLMSEYARRTSVPCSFLEADSLYVNIVDEFVKKEHEAVVSFVPEARDISRIHEREILQMGMYLPDKEIPEILSRLPGCTYTRWKTNGVDIIPVGGNKWVGVQKIMEHFGLSPEQTMSFGDNDNDLEMLANSGISVAMGNAADNVKAVADYITADVDEDGIDKAMRELFDWM